MTRVRPAAGPEPAQWLLAADVSWWDLVRYGPPGFDTYLRITLDSRPHAETAGESPGMRHALEVLARHTSTPESAYAAIWEGWTSTADAPVAPVVPIPERTMLLFTGPVPTLRDAPALAWQVDGTAHEEPHLVWPADQAWCLACDVDEEIEFSVGCSEPAALALARELRDAVRRVTYGEDSPLYREP